LFENRSDLLLVISSTSPCYAEKIRFKFRKNVPLCLSISGQLNDVTNFLSTLKDEELTGIKNISHEIQINVCIYLFNEKSLKGSIPNEYSHLGLKLAIRLSIFSNIWLIEKIDVRWVFEKPNRILLFLCLCLTNLQQSVVRNDSILTLENPL
jgi:hypothetical protein